MLRTARVGCVVLAALIAGGGTAGAKQPAVPKKACTVKHGKTVARSGGERLITADGPADELYGAPTAIYGCRRADRPPVLLRSAQSALTVSIGVVRFTQWYVAYTEYGTDEACAKSTPRDPACDYSRVVSYDLRTGRQKTSADGSGTALVLSTKGWPAWVSPPAADGTREVHATDAAGTRLLDSGNVDPASLAISGATVSWTRDGVVQTAALG